MHSGHEGSTAGTALIWARRVFEMQSTQVLGACSQWLVRGVLGNSGGSFISVQTTHSCLTTMAVEQIGARGLWLWQGDIEEAKEKRRRLSVRLRL